MDWGKFIKKRRLELDLPASKLGVPDVIYGYEKGDRWPKLETVKKIHKILDIDNKLGIPIFFNTSLKRASIKLKVEISE